MLSMASGSRARTERASRRFMSPMVRSTGAVSSSTFAAVSETSQPVELLLGVTRDGPGTLGAQIEDRLRTGIRAGALKPGAQLPSTRDLAHQLGVSRRVVVDA